MPDLTPQEIARGCLLRIVAQPGRYEQQTWQTVVAEDVAMPRNGRAEVSCATTGCVAGTAAMLAGDRGLAIDGHTRIRNGRLMYDISTVITATGKQIGIRERGQDLLGLTDGQSGWLFDGSRRLPEVVNALVELSESRPLSYKLEADMTDEEVQKLMNYRIPKLVKRQHVPAETAVPNTQTVGVHQHGN